MLVLRAASVFPIIIGWIDSALVNDVLYVDYLAKTKQCRFNLASSGNGRQMKVLVTTKSSQPIS